MDVNDEYALSPITPPVINPSTDPSDVVHTTQQIRLLMLKELTKGGVPKDSDEVKTLSLVLRDLDAAALTTRKIDVEEKAVGEQARAIDAVQDIAKLYGGRNPFLANPDGSLNADALREIRGSRVTDEAALPPPRSIPGMDKQGQDDVSPEDFIK